MQSQCRLGCNPGREGLLFNNKLLHWSHQIAQIMWLLIAQKQAQLSKTTYQVHLRTTPSQRALQILVNLHRLRCQPKHSPKSNKSKMTLKQKTATF